MLPDDLDTNNRDLPIKKDKIIQPLPSAANAAESNEAVKLIRNKISHLYENEPEARKEQAESEAAGTHRTKHQQFMYDLSHSGRSLAEIQVAWHNYYTNLPDHEKHQVWQEFYSNHAKTSEYVRKTASPKPEPQPLIPPQYEISTNTKLSDVRSVSDLKKQVLKRVRTRATTPSRKSAHRRSLAFGLSMGSIVLIIMLFGFFNERFIAPFITPSRNVSSTPIILDSTAAVGPEPKIIIPKINVEIPVIYDEPSVDEKAVQRALEGGVLHYATTEKPGEAGNAVVFGHSSNNILNKGKYKFAFVLLNRLENGDTFMLHRDGKRYVYKVFEKKVVKPEEVGVLNDYGGKAAVATLITCDPPGTSINRLIVVGEQISPDPSTNAASSVADSTSSVAVLPSNAPSLWSRFWNWMSR